MPVGEITTVCFVGAGTMGCYNALAAAVSGYRAVLYDVSAQSLANTEKVLGDMAAFLVGGGYCAESDIPAALSRITTCDDLARATSKADLVSESVFERLDIKREIHRQLDAVCPSHTIITTNSSVLLVSAIEDVVGRGDRFAAMHTHLGAPLVDIVPGPRTDDSTLDVLKRYVVSTGGVPLLMKKENPGYVLNAMLGPLLGTALAMHVRDGVAVASIDAAWMSSQQAPMGPFGMIDLFGVNLIHDTWQNRNRKDVLQAIQPQVLALLGPMVERGELGMKTGAGFYQYPEPAYQQADFSSSDRGDDIDSVSRALAVALIGNAVIIAANEIVEPSDVDRAWKVGTYLQRGPFELLNELGRKTFYSALEDAVNRQLFGAGGAEKVRHWLKLHPRGA